MPTTAAPPLADHEPSRVDADALDTLVGVLRAYGKFAIGTERQSAERTHSVVEQWVKHATLGQPLQGASTRAGQRQWRALMQQFAQHRRDETGAISESLDRLRDTVWLFIGNLHQASLDDTTDEAAIASDLQALRAALEEGSTDDLRHAAGSAISTFTTLLADRRERQRRQMAVLGERLASLTDELDAARKASTLDALTGLANRKEFDDFLHRLVELHGFVPAPACLLMIDLDGFKQLNDACGHQCGDEALRQVARCMARTFLRKCDFVCRYGGDEFAVVLRDTPAVTARGRAEQLREAVAGIALPGAARRATLTLSVGIAELVEGESLDTWVRRADRALYAAKDAGRDRVVQAPAEILPEL